MELYTLRLVGFTYAYTVQPGSKYFWPTNPEHPQPIYFPDLTVVYHSHTFCSMLWLPYYSIPSSMSYLSGSSLLNKLLKLVNQAGWLAAVNKTWWIMESLLW